MGCVAREVKGETHAENQQLKALVLQLRKRETRKSLTPSKKGACKFPFMMCICKLVCKHGGSTTRLVGLPMPNQQNSAIDIPNYKLLCSEDRSANACPDNMLASVLRLWEGSESEGN